MDDHAQHPAMADGDGDGAGALDAPEQDFYAAHLAHLNETRNVVSTDDIVNERGMLLCRRGAPIDHPLAERLVRHKLHRPLEEQVLVQGGLEGKALHARIQSLLASYPDLAQLHEAQDFEDDCRNMLLERELHLTL